VAAGGMVQSGERAEQRSLASAVVAEDGVELPAGKFGSNAAQGSEATELLDQVVYGYDGRVVSQLVRF